MFMKRQLAALRDCLVLAHGLARHAWTGKAYEPGHQAMVRLFCRSGGRSNDLLARLYGLLHPPRRLAPAASVLGIVTPEAAAAAAAAIARDGYHVFPQRLPEATCAALERFACVAPCRLRSDAGPPVAVPAYARAAPAGVRYDLVQAAVLGQPLVQEVLADGGLLAVAQAYLGCRPILDIVSMWWHTAAGDGPSEDAAQFFHFDLDRFRWLKFFIYLTDVGPEQGPHEFVRGSQATGGIPAPLLKQGYVRLQDAAVFALLDERDRVVFTAPRGTIIAEDTRGLHKGRMVGHGDRLMLQVQYSAGTFGATTPRMAVTDPIPALDELWRRRPELFTLCDRRSRDAGR